MTLPLPHRRDRRSRSRPSTASPGSRATVWATCSAPSTWQRGLAQNEKRQGENQPYGTVWITIAENTYPRGHPYSWSLIGSMEDLKAASRDDVKEWFRDYYGAANAMLVVAGDVNPGSVDADGNPAGGAPARALVP
jgi:hypothetical protein